MQFPFYSAHRVAEAVGRGHPDRVADQLADKVVDLVLEQDSQAAIGVEVLLSREGITIAGEIDAEQMPPLEGELRKVLGEVGIHTLTPLTFQLHSPSVEITRATEAGTFADQAIATGFATNEHPTYLPLPQALAKEAISLLEATEGLGKDGKLLCFLEGDRIKELRISWQMEKDGPTVEALRTLFFSKIPSLQKDSLIVFHPFFHGGLQADTGLTGRKVVSDGYGSEIPYGGGALSGKDGGKVDRLGTYLARLIAKSFVRDQGRQWAFVTLTLVFGEKNLHTIEIQTEKGPEKYLFKASKGEIVDLLQLQKPLFYKTAVEGPFTGDYPWETVSISSLRPFH